jgi:hypothetical protein
MTLEFVKNAVNQDTGRRVKVGEVVQMGEMEGGRHLAEGNAVPMPDRVVERAIEQPPERRAIRPQGRSRK